MQIIRAGNGISHAEHIERVSYFPDMGRSDLSKTLEKEATMMIIKSDFEKESINGTTIIHYTGDKGLMKLDTPKVDIRRLLVDESLWSGNKDEIVLYTS